MHKFDKNILRELLTKNKISHPFIVNSVLKSFKNSYYTIIPNSTSILCSYQPVVADDLVGDFEFYGSRLYIDGQNYNRVGLLNTCFKHEFCSEINVNQVDSHFFSHQESFSVFSALKSGNISVDIDTVRNYEAVGMLYSHPILTRERLIVSAGMQLLKYARYDLKLDARLNIPKEIANAQSLNGEVVDYVKEKEEKVCRSGRVIAFAIPDGLDSGFTYFAYRPSFDSRVVKTDKPRLKISKKSALDIKTNSIFDNNVQQVLNAVENAKSLKINDVHEANQLPGKLFTKYDRKILRI